MVADLVGDVLAEGGVAVDPPAVVEGVPLAVPGARIDFGQKLVKIGQTGVRKPWSWRARPLPYLRARIVPCEQRIWLMHYARAI